MGNKNRIPRKLKKKCKKLAISKSNPYLGWRSKNIRIWDYSFKSFFVGEAK